MLEPYTIEQMISGLKLVMETRPERRRVQRENASGSATDLSFVLHGLPEGQRDDMINRYIWSRLGKGLSEAEISTLISRTVQECIPAFDESDALDMLRRALTKIPVEGDQIHLTDTGNSRRLARLYGARIKYCEQFGYLVYDGTRWVPDSTSRIQSFAKDVGVYLHAVAARISDDKIREAWSRFAIKSEATARIDAMIKLLPSEPNISVCPEVFDRDPMLFNVLNGTIDLRTGTLCPHNPDDLITKLSSVEYNPTAKAQRWEQFVIEIMDKNQELASFLQRLLGYGQTGLTKEQIWGLLQGSGQNGKGTLMETLGFIMGDYFVTTPPETFLETNAGAIRNDLARLRGARIVSSAEPKNRRFDPAVLKTFTGEDTISARYLHKEFFEFKPEGKLLFQANLRPDVRDTSHGFWRRVLFIPFRKRFSDSEKDPNLRETLKREASGILNWLVQGCLAWQRNGLHPPKEVMEAVQDYRNATDLLAEFFETKCEFGSNHVTAKASLYEAYLAYCEESRIRKPLARQKFNEDLRGRDGIAECREGSARTKAWRGIALKGAEGCNANVHYLRTCGRCDVEHVCPVEHRQRDAKSCKYFRSCA
jgi:putative DNA primase/helicase